MTKRHPAQASRILTAGLSTATMLGIVAVLGGHTAAAPPAQAPQPAKVAAVGRAPDARQPAAVIQRAPPTTRAARHHASPSPRRAPDTTTGPS